MDESITTERHVAQMSTFLLVATIATYIPQYRRIRKRRDATGISTWYLVFTTIATTEQFALLLVLSVMNVPDDYDFPGRALIRYRPCKGGST
ncbi:unnamed protein product [Parascedosporium putredinis]|uniref:Uncharacterized protein n=1 Tax=Parascedosporium putredinis TaxID=1442378 RepID=A0A9P1MFJ2_9PEZI|nr:unnamed protein product [Parascedosporium putredinis]CAI8002468.1 unnamed protein product [Parascedosporium putredinis]